MNGGNFERVIHVLHENGASGCSCRWCDHIPAAAHIVATLAYLVVLSSFGKYSIAGVAGMAFYPVVLAIIWKARIFRGIAGLWYVFVPVVLIGAANPFFDREIVAVIGPLKVSGGWLSFAVLCGKGVLALLAGRLLYQIVGISGMVRALGSFGLPSSVAFSFMLMHRYLLLLVKETARMRDAHSLRSGGRTALAPSTWGSFAGLLLLRSSDRAKCVHAAATLRGCDREAVFPVEDRGLPAIGWGWVSFWLACFVFARVFDIVGEFGELVLRIISLF